MKRGLVSKPDLIADPTPNFERYQLNKEATKAPIRILRAGVSSLHEPVSRRARGVLNFDNASPGMQVVMNADPKAIFGDLTPSKVSQHGSLMNDKYYVAVKNLNYRPNLNLVRHRRQ